MSKAVKPELPSTITDTLTHYHAVGNRLLELNSLIRSLATELEVTITSPLKLARAFVALHRLHEQMESTASELAKLFIEYKSRVVPEVFESHGVPHVPLSEGYRVGVSTLFRATVNKDRRDDAYQWLRDNGLQDLVIETVNASTLSSAAQVMRDDDNKELPPELFKTYDLPTTSVVSTKPS